MLYRTTRIFFVLALATMARLPVAQAQQDTGYKPVDADQLSSNLDKFWATGLAFVDTVTQPLSAESQRVGKKTYVRFETKLAGVCYVDAALGARLQQLQPGKDFVFTATVLQRPRGFFSFGRDAKYFIAILNLQPALGTVSSIPDQLATFILPTNSTDAILLANLGTLMKGIQTDLALLARERKVEPWELLAPGSTNRLDAERLITAGVAALASEMKVPPQEVLGQVLMALVTARVQPEAPAPAPEPDVKAVPEVKASVTNEAAAREKAEADKKQADLADAKKAKEEQERLAAQERDRIATEDAARAKMAKMEKLQQEKERADKEKALREESERLAAEKAAQEKKAAAAKADADKKARAAQAAEKLRLEQEKKAQAEQAALQAKQEKARQEMELRAKAEAEAAAAAAAQATGQQPKLRASTTVEAVRVEPAPEIKPVQPSAKLQPAPVAPKATVPATPADDLNAPVPL